MSRSEQSSRRARRDRGAGNAGHVPGESLIAADDWGPQAVFQFLDDVERAQVRAGEEDRFHATGRTNLEGRVADRARINPGDSRLDLLAEGKRGGHFEAVRDRPLGEVDGDGFASRAFLPGAPLSGNVLLDQFIANTDLPHTISVIEGEVGEAGLYPESHEEFEAVARRIFREPNVELASHSYSHPFFWQASLLKSSDKTLYGLNLPIPNYEIDLDREINGSVDYINTKLAPPNKKVKVFLTLCSTSH